VAQEERKRDDQGTNEETPASEPRDRGDALGLDEEEAKGAGVEGAEGAEDEPQNRRARRAAASQARKVRMKERQTAEAVGLDTQEMLDEALVRSSDKATKWLRKNSSLLQGMVVAGIVVWAGWGIYSWRLARSQQEASDAVAAAVQAERGKVGDPAEQGKPNAQQVIDPTPIFADRAAQLKASEEGFASAVKFREGEGTSAYAELSRAAVLLDNGKADEAKVAFDAVKRSKFAQTDAELRGRAIEGEALALEAKGDKAAALKSYQELENTETAGFKELALYQQARLQRDLKQLDAAKELVKRAQARLGTDAKAAPSGFGPAPGYVQRGLQALAEELGIEEPAAAPGAGAPAGDITEAQLKALQEQLQEQLGKAQGGGAPAAPGGQ
jgi:predicted negative regulator of RcsB-dependent stress response